MIKTKPKYPRFPKNMTGKAVSLYKMSQMIRRHLTNNKWKIVGTGATSIVYEHKKYPNWVLKVYNDEGYNDYYNKTRKLENPHIPFGMRQKVIKKSRTRTLRMVLIEKLNDERSNIQIVNSFKRGWKLKKYPELRLLHPLIINLAKKHILDIHQGNIMWRGDIPVITDPVI